MTDSTRRSPNGPDSSGRYDNPNSAPNVAPTTTPPVVLEKPSFVVLPISPDRVNAAQTPPPAGSK
jgi:hypothetical protein